MLIRFYHIVIRSSRMLYMIGIKEILIFDGIRSPSICKLHGTVITHAVSIPNKKKHDFDQNFCTAIRSSRMLYMKGMKEIRIF